MNKESMLFDGYMNAIEFTDTDNLDFPEYHGAPYAEDFLISCREDCAGFLDDNKELIAQSGLTYEEVGHDFWLTRNGHGTGFWDRGLGAVGTMLSCASEMFGSVDLYVDDGGYIRGNR